MVTAAGLGVLETPAASADTNTYAPKLDTYVSSAKPSATFGGSQTLYASATTFRSFVRFDVSALTSSGATINGLTFSPYITFVSGSAPTVSIYSTDNTWAANSTWASTTTQRTACTGAPLASVTPVAAHRVAITLPASVVSSAGVVNLCVASTGTSQVRFASNESANKPQLAVDSTPVVIEPSSVAMTLQDPTITDASSWAQSRVTSGVRWTNQDRTYQHPVAYAVGPDGQTLARVTMTGTGVTNIDSEDAATAVLDGTPYVYIEDGGGNADVRSSVSVSRFVEPAIDPAVTDQALTADAQSWTFTYPVADLNASRVAGPDSEALLVNPATGRIYVILKSKLGLATGTTRWGVYAAPEEADNAPGSYPLTKIATTTVAATGAAWSPDGTEIALRTYKNVNIYKVVNGDVATALAIAPLVLTPPTMQQGEGISFGADGQAVELSSEDHAATKPDDVIRQPLPTAYWDSALTYQ